MHIFSFVWIFWICWWLFDGTGSTRLRQICSFVLLICKWMRCWRRVVIMALQWFQVFFYFMVGGRVDLFGLAFWPFFFNFQISNLWVCGLKYFWKHVEPTFTSRHLSKTSCSYRETIQCPWSKVKHESGPLIGHLCVDPTLMCDPNSCSGYWISSRSYTILVPCLDLKGQTRPCHLTKTEDRETCPSLFQFDLIRASPTHTPSKFWIKCVFCWSTWYFEDLLLFLYLLAI